MRFNIAALLSQKLDSIITLVYASKESCYALRNYEIVRECRSSRMNGFRKATPECLRLRFHIHITAGAANCTLQQITVLISRIALIE